ncbi:hypothetical protein [Alishewanella sp. WH16-1]|uniref:hypothetical protein n=1 Tax=Alishewanella sp. WH16-1 TaxID=1651088 RepID=UPI00070C2D7E|nr:hypothetical protein [Alishewanella sp. WH16-1]
MNSWFHPVLGNHESFILTYDEKNAYKKSLWHANGGDWWELISDLEKEEVINIIKTRYSLTATVQTEIGYVGIVHADYPYNFWGEDIDINDFNFLKRILWGRERLNRSEDEVIQNIDLVVSGHSPVLTPVLKGNSLFIDTGSGYEPSNRIPNPCLTIGFFKNNSFFYFSLSNNFKQDGQIDLSKLLQPE